MSQAEFAAALGISRQTLYDVLNQKQPVTANAVRLAKLLGNGARLWVSMHRNSALAVAQRDIDVSQINTPELV